MQTLNANLVDSRRGDIDADLLGQGAIRRKLPELQAEFERGQQQLAALDRNRGILRDTLLRISGAIQVLEDLLQSESSPNGEDSVATSDNRGASACICSGDPPESRTAKNPWPPAEKFNQLTRKQRGKRKNMNDKFKLLEKRLEELRIELAKGQRQLEMIDIKRQEVRDTVLRITGAIRVLEEILQPSQVSPERVESAVA